MGKVDPRWNGPQLQQSYQCTYFPFSMVRRLDLFAMHNSWVIHNRIWSGPNRRGISGVTIDSTMTQEGVTTEGQDRMGTQRVA